MRTTHWKAHLLPLLLMSLYSVSMCLASKCDFDRTGKGYTLQDIVTAKPQPIGKDWEPLRIFASTKDFHDPSKYCLSESGVIDVRGTKDADGSCHNFFAILTADQQTMMTGIIERAIALHTDRLRVQRAIGPLIIPDLSTHEFCKYFNVPAEHRTNGVPNADMVLYVAAVSKSGNDFGDFSLGLTCAKSTGGRPIAGALSIVSEGSEISRHTVRLAAHHIAHALGFSYGEMKSHNMIVNKDKVRDKPNPVAVVKSDKTKEMTQAHYGCPAADGMELEDGEDNNEMQSHWERRNAKDELMSTPAGSHNNLFMGFYTAITLAVFEDLGVYKANFHMAEHMEYGYEAGCDFLTAKCIANGVTKWPNMFCTVPISTVTRKFCPTDRLGLGICLLKGDHDSPLPEHFQYFASPTAGGLGYLFTDYCPVVEQAGVYRCKNPLGPGVMHGSLVGKNSMCLDGSELKVKTSKGATAATDGVCAEISCEGGSLRVKYLGDPDKWHDCPEGKSLTPSSTSTSFVSGTIKCPKYKEVCTVAPDGSSLVLKVIDESIEPSSSAPPTASQDPKASQEPKASDKPTGKPNDSNSGGKSKDGSSVPFGLILSVAFLVLSFAGSLIA